MKRTIIVMLLVTVVAIPTIVAIRLQVELSAVEHTLAVERDDLELNRKMAMDCLAELNTSPVAWGVPEASLPPLSGPAKQLEGNYRFTTNYFGPHMATWTQAMSGFSGKKNLRYLEVGVFEGRSAVWMLENVLTDPTSEMTAIDIFPDDLKDTFLANVAAAGALDRVVTMVGYSQERLRELPLNYFDIIYIDGSHHGPDVLEDAVLSRRLLKSGGMLIFDDYLWHSSDHFVPDIVRPKMAVDTFFEFYGGEFELIHNGWQVMLRKN